MCRSNSCVHVFRTPCEYARATVRHAHVLPTDCETCAEVGSGAHIRDMQGALVHAQGCEWAGRLP